jgi:hypothetical protein
MTDNPDSTEEYGWIAYGEQSTYERFISERLQTSMANNGKLRSRIESLEVENALANKVIALQEKLIKNLQDLLKVADRDEE